MNEARLPVLIVSGFLGSGKTTLLRQALGDPRFERSLVIVNEAAPLGIDDRLLRAVTNGPVALLGSGCLCCVVQDDLKRSLLEVVDDQSLAGRVDRVVIETSGLADPVSVIATLSAHPRLTARLRLQAVASTVDALHAESQLEESPEFAAQVQCADLLLVTKSDLAGAERAHAVSGLVGSMNPLATVIDRADRPIEALLHASSRFTTGPPASRWLPYADPGQSDNDYVRLARVGGSARDRHTRGVAAFAITVSRRLDWVAFSTWLSLLVHAHGPKLLRIKGVIDVADGETPVVVNVVRHVVHFPEHLAEASVAPGESRLVFLVRDIAPAVMLRSMSAFVGDGCRLASEAQFPASRG